MKTNQKTKVVPYMRAASIQQDGHSSFEYQQKVIETFCRENDFEIAETFRDIGSGVGLYREGLTNAIKYLIEHKDEANILLVARLDRFSRSTIDAVIVLEKLREQGIILMECEPNKNVLRFENGSYILRIAH